MNHAVLGQDDVSNGAIHLVLAAVYTKLKPKENLDKALDSLQTVWALYESVYTNKSEQVAKVHLELAKLYKKMKQIDKAIDE